MDSTQFNRLIRSSPLREWINGSIESFWLYGSAGTGKTVLSTQIIEHLQALCDKEGKLCLYFYFRRVNQESLVDMLGSIIAQLCRQTLQLPEPLRDMYNLCEKGKLAPLKEYLIQVLDSLLITTASKRIYLFLEGLDECSERDEVFQLIRSLLQLRPNVSLFISSRKEPDITNALQDLMDCSVDILSPPEDIKVHISRYIRKVVKEFEPWPSELKVEVQKALVEKCDGE
jgi:ankyrin repeat domain-containing protein 50